MKSVSFRWFGLGALVILAVCVASLYAANPNTPGTCLWYGPDGGTMTLVNSTNPLPITAPNSLQTNGVASEGAVASGNPNRVAGWDGANLRTLSTDTAGRLYAHGPAASGSAAVGNPLLMGSYDGANVNSVRSPNIFKTVQANASGDNALWTPAGGKKFRLMRLKIDVPANCTLAARGVEVIKLRDATTDISVTTDVWLGQTTPVETASSQIPNFTTGWLDLGNGVLSSAANNVLNVNLGTALATGNVRVTAIGTEE